MSITPPIIHQGDAWADAPERYKLFSIVDADGKTTDYSMPRAKHPGIVLEYLRQARRSSDELASSWLLERVLGEDGYSALVAEPGLTFETINQIARAAYRVLTGRVPAQAEPEDEPAAGAGDADPFD